MKASRFIVEKCIVDNDDTIQLLVSNEQHGCFVPIYLSFDHAVVLLDHFDGDESVDERLFRFMQDTWSQFGFRPVSVIIDNDNLARSKVSYVTFTNIKHDNIFMFITTPAPLESAVMISVFLDVPVFITERAENSMLRFDITKIDEYVKNVEKSRENDDGPLF